MYEVQQIHTLHYVFVPYIYMFLTWISQGICKLSQVWDHLGLKAQR